MSIEVSSIDTTVGFSPKNWMRAHSRPIGMSIQLVALGLAIWLLVLPQLRGSGHSLRPLADVNPGWIAFAVVAELCSLGFYTLATRSMLPRETRPSLNRVMRIDLSAIALGHCVPDGGAAGTALSWRLLVGAGVPTADAGFAKLVQGLGSAVVLQVLLLIALLVGATVSGFSRWSLLPGAAAAAILLTAWFVIICLRQRGFRRRARRLLRSLPRFGTRISAAADVVYHRHVVGQLGSAVGQPRRLALAGSWAAGNWIFDAVALWASLRAYGHGISIEALAVAFGVASLATWLPITPSGLGISEGLMIPALIAFGTPRSTAVLGILMWRLVAYWLPIPLGATAYSSLRLGNRFARQPQAAV
jgi:uncharacterized protein (TIRG00374 family)